VMAVGTCANGCPAGTLPTGVGPTQFSLSQGQPLVSSTMFDVGAFVQDDWRVAQGLTVSAGLRWEGQTNIHDWHDAAPRLAFAWAPGRSSAKGAPALVIRGGVGMFYIRYANTNNLSTLEYNGKNQETYEAVSYTHLDVYKRQRYDHIDFLTEPVRLADELAKSGIHAMKIWPFDPVAKESGGQYITADQLRRGIEPLRLIREAFGDSMEVAMEFHGYWNLPSAIRIAQALEPFAPMWLEEMLPQDNLAAYHQLAAATRLPLCLSCLLYTSSQRWSRELLPSWRVP